MHFLMNGQPGSKLIQDGKVVHHPYFNKYHLWKHGIPSHHFWINNTLLYDRSPFQILEACVNQLHGIPHNFILTCIFNPSPKMSRR